ncbi:hypothetical protein MRX96_046393 [Rhipicephalus microplus]
MELFLESSSTYEEAVKPLFPETRKRIKVAVSSIYITTQHVTLLERLQDLREKVQEKSDAAATPWARIIPSAAITNINKHLGSRNEIVHCLIIFYKCISNVIGAILVSDHDLREDRVKVAGGMYV